MSSDRRSAALYGKARRLHRQLLKEKFARIEGSARGDHPRRCSYGVDAPKATSRAKKHGFNVVLKEGYSISAPDLSSLSPS